MDDKLPQIRLKIARRSGHPWIFQKMVEKPAVRIPPGSVVDIVDKDGQWVGRGFYNGHSRISLRVLTARPDEAIDADFFRRRLTRALDLRRAWLKLDAVSDAYRLVHSEGDELSGLVVDRFGSTLVLEFFSAGMFRFRQVILDVLLEHFPGSQSYWFAEEHVQKQESFDCRASETPAPNIVTEHGLRFRVAPGSKHKTGFFLDQRDNRKRLAEFCAGKRVLDICCNTGGFAVYAKALGGAEEVIGIDLDEEAIAMAKQNANLNQARVRFVQADLFAYLRDILGVHQREQESGVRSQESGIRSQESGVRDRESGGEDQESGVGGQESGTGDQTSGGRVQKAGVSPQSFDVVILDPAKQTRDREEIDYALKRYLDMNRLALRAVSPGGIFLTCSCTGLISEETFLDTVRRASWQAGRPIQVLHLSGAGPDHPFLVHVPEGRYLKAIWCRVD